MDLTGILLELLHLASGYAAVYLMFERQGLPRRTRRIGMALAMRDLSRHVREVTGRETRHAGFEKKDRSRFLAALENAIQGIRRTTR